MQHPDLIIQDDEGSLSGVLGMKETTSTLSGP